MSATSLAGRRNGTFTVLVTGSRTWTDQQCIHDQLDALLAEHGSIVLIHGACPKGADAMADHWGRRKPNVLIDRYPARWNEHGRSAGYVRNVEMVQAGPDLCLAFVHEASRGATQCATAAERSGVPVIWFRRWKGAPVGVA